MDIVEGLGAAFIGLLVVSAVVQIVFSYSLQVIAEKNELPDFAAFLSWIPLLNIYPLIRCGGGSFKKLMLGIVGLIVLGAASAALAAQIGALVAAIVGGVIAIGSVVYIVSIMMATASNRGLPGWIGLLGLVPVVNLFVYPYIAFHDGFRAPNKVGLVLGLLLAFGPIPGQMAMVDTIKESVAAYQQGAGQIQMPNADNSATSQAMNAAVGDLGSAIEIGTQLAMLDGMDPSDPQQAEMMRGEIDELHAKVTRLETSLGSDTASEFRAALVEMESRLEPAPPEASHQPSGTVLDAPEPTSVPSTTPEPTPPPDARVADRTVLPLSPVPASQDPLATESVGRDGDRGFPVPHPTACPAGAGPQGAAPPAGNKRWCEKTGSSAGIKHGWMTEWYANGQPRLAGEYRDGLQVGVWTRWYDSGVKRAQAEFEAGLQDGALIAWDESGRKVYEGRFEAGAPTHQ